MKSHAQIALTTWLAIVMSAAPPPPRSQVGETISAPTWATAALQGAPLNVRGAWHARSSRRDRAVGVAPAYSDTPATTVESAVELARQAWTRFDYRRALDLLDQASRDARDSPVLLAAYASVYLKAEEPGRARQ